MPYKSLSGIYGFLITEKGILLLHAHKYSVSNYILIGVKIVGPIMIEVLNEDVGLNFKI